MRNITLLIMFGIFMACIGASTFLGVLKTAGYLDSIPTKYETGEILKYKGRVFMLIEVEK